MVLGVSGRGVGVGSGADVESGIGIGTWRAIEDGSIASVS